MKNLKMYLKVKYCEVNKESNLHIASVNYNLPKSPQRQHNTQKNTYCVSHAVHVCRIMLINTVISVINRTLFFKP
jgi:hypothetical protein